MNTVVKFVSITASIIIAVITITFTILEVYPFQGMVTENQAKYNQSIVRIKEDEYDKYDSTVIIGAEVIQLVSASEDSDIGIIVEIHDGIRTGNGDKADLTESNLHAKSRYLYGTPIGVEARDTEEYESVPYLRSKDTDDEADQELFCQTDESFANCKFNAKLIRNANKEIVGIYFKQEI